MTVNTFFSFWRNNLSMEECAKHKPVYGQGNWMIVEISAIMSTVMQLHKLDGFCYFVRIKLLSHTIVNVSFSKILKLIL